MIDHNARTRALTMTIAVVIAVAAAVSAPAWAQIPDSFDGSARVETRIVSPAGGVAPGDDALLVIRMTHDEHWHTYWPGRNDTGLGTTIAFDDAEGLSLGDPIWPTPERHLAPGDILDHVYEGEVEVLIPIHADAALEHGATLPVRARVDFLVCKDLCLPGTDRVETTLRIDERARTPRRTSARGAFPERLGARSASWESGKATLRVPDAASYVFFPLETCAPIEDLIRDGAQEGPEFTIKLRSNGAPPRLAGRLLVTHRDGTESHFDVDLTPTSPEEGP